MSQEIEDLKNDPDSPYCPICTGCGEEGCCSPTICDQHPDGHYCRGYLADLKLSYKISEDIYKVIFDKANSEKYKELIETYNNSFEKYCDLYMSPQKEEKND